MHQLELVPLTAQNYTAAALRTARIPTTLAGPSRLSHALTYHTTGGSIVNRRRRPWDVAGGEQVSTLDRVTLRTPPCHVSRVDRVDHASDCVRSPHVAGPAADMTWAKWAENSVGTLKALSTAQCSLHLPDIAPKPQYELLGGRALGSYTERELEHFIRLLRFLRGESDCVGDNRLHFKSEVCGRGTKHHQACKMLADLMRAPAVAGGSATRTAETSRTELHLHVLVHNNGGEYAPNNAEEKGERNNGWTFPWAYNTLTSSGPTRLSAAVRSSFLVHFVPLRAYHTAVFFLFSAGPVWAWAVYVGDERRIDIACGCSGVGEAYHFGSLRKSFG